MNSLLVLTLALAALARPAQAATLAEKEACVLDLEAPAATPLEARWRAARAQVLRDLGSLPVMKDDGEDIHAYPNETDDTQMAWLAYRVDGNKMRIVSMFTYNPWKQKGIMRLMVAEALRAHPQVTDISVSDLAFDNETVFLAGLTAGLNEAEAMMTTPAYRTLKSLGFAELTQTRQKPTITFSVRASD